MKKAFILFSLCVAIAACGGNQNSNEASDADSATASDQTAESRNPEVDTSVNNIGTNRAEGTGDEASTGAGKGKDLIAQSDCLGCHKIDQKLVGPAYEEVAAKYEMNDKNLDYLSQKIIEGGQGVWGQVPMTPHPAISKDDAKEMAKYILSLKK